MRGYGAWKGGWGPLCKMPQCYLSGFAPPSTTAAINRYSRAAGRVLLRELSSTLLISSLQHVHRESACRWPRDIRGRCRFELPAKLQPSVRRHELRVWTECKGYPQHRIVELVSWQGRASSSPPRLCSQCKHLTHRHRTFAHSMELPFSHLPLLVECPTSECSRTSSMSS